MVTLTSEKEKLLKDILNNYPGYNDSQIGKQLKITRQTVAKYRKQIDLKYDSEFVKIVAGKFIKAYGRAEEYWLHQIDRLEVLKNSTHTIYIKNEKTEGSFEKEISLLPMEILAIEKHQSELHEKILFLASQGEVRQVIRIMRMGKIPMLESE